MNEQQHHDEPRWQVTDRRHFTEAGERRAGVEAKEFEEAPAAGKTTAPAASGNAGGRKAAQPAAPPVPAPEPPAKPAAPAPMPERLSAREVNLAALFEQLYIAGMMQLGAEIQPGQRGQVDIEGASETIDLLAVLQQKTQGNLDAHEERVLTSMLYELRLAYVEVKQAQNRVQPAAAMPPPPRPRR